MAFDFPSTGLTIGQAYGNYIWDGQKWTLPSLVDAVAARQSVYAAPFDALAYNGMQINGSMEVNQENAAPSISNATKYVVDGFGAAVFGTGAASTGQSAFTNQVPGLINFLTFTCTTVNSLAGSSDGQWIYQNIEGFRWARLGFGTASAQPVTIGFWILSEVGGTMAVSLRNGNRVYATDVVVAIGVWQYKTVTIPGDVGGTWVKNNTAAVALTFCFGAGSARKVAANTWLAAADYTPMATAATTNFFTSAPKGIYISGVVVLPGIEAPSAARSALIMRPFDQELLTCKRYWQPLIGSTFSGQATSAVGMLLAGNAPVTMRANPVTTLLKTSYVSASFEILCSGAWLNGSSISLGSPAPNLNGIVTSINGFTGLTTAAPVTFNTGNTTIMSLDARL